MKAILFWAVRLTLCAVFFLTAQHAQAQSDVYDSGTVWTLSTIRIDANMDDEYLQRLSKTWKAMMDEAKKEQLILGYKILKGNAANQDDFNLLLMVEYRNLSSMDPDPARDAKWKAIRDRIQARPDHQDILQRYGEIRQFFGQKVMREIVLK
ncbi:MAG: hypothetical protein H6577_00035 [Lewinellaceae bacterium]|nr:hypothetical protein [Saprospiraceae bacterium]MCB9336499.1 hypothetical protein [Lewinellaceae bacterium]